jgi:chromosome segregation ATPase
MHRLLKRKDREALAKLKKCGIVLHNFRKGLRIPLTKNSSRNNVAVKGNYTTKVKSSRGKETRYKTFDDHFDSAKGQPKDSYKELANKYEDMLKKVNEEFQSSLEKNAELAKVIAELELRLYRTQKEFEKSQKLDETKQLIDKENVEKSKTEIQELKSKNQELAKNIKEKDDEIARLRNLQIKLENKILSTDEVSMQSPHNHTETKNKITSLSSKCNMLESKLLDRESELQRASMINDDLRQEIQEMQTLETRREFDMKRNREESSNFQFENQNLKEKLAKAGIIIKQTMSELEDLRRDRNLTKNTIAVLEAENSNLGDKVTIYQETQEKVIDGLMALESYVSSPGQDFSIVRSKISYLINSMRMGMDITMKSSGVFSTKDPSSCSYFEYRSNSGLSDHLSSSVMHPFNYRTPTCS